MKKLSLALGLVSTSVALFNCDMLAAKTKPVPTAFSVQLPMVRQATVLYPFSGEYRASEFTQIVAETDGKIVEVYFKDGQHVKKGDPLYRLDEDYARLTLATAENEYRLAMQNLLEITRQYGSKEARALLAEQSVERARTRLLKAKSAMAKQTIYSPFSGKIGKNTQSAGTYVTPGTVLTDLVATDKVELHFSAPAAQMDAFSELVNDQDPENSPVVSVSHGNTTAYTDGTLHYVGSVIDQNTGNVDAYALFDNSNSKIIVGTKTRLYLNAPQKQKVMLVPQSAVQQIDGQSYVYVLNEQRVVLEQPIEPIYTKESFTGYVALSGGLSAKSFIVNDDEAPHLVGNRIEPSINVIEQLNEVLYR